jgi:hypothetical protein
MPLTHKEARRKLGSRSVRRSGISVIRLRSGANRKTTKDTVAVATRKLIKADLAGTAQVKVAVASGHGWVGR